MSRTEDRRRLADSVHAYETTFGPLPGISNPDSRDVFIEQLIESGRRIRYLMRMRERGTLQSCTDPQSHTFNPLRSSIFHQHEGNLDESFWMIFLYVHFGKNRKSGWQLISDIYGRLGQGDHWTWQEVHADTSEFRRWLDSNVEAIRALSPRRSFGNHRKYESLDAWSTRGTGEAVQSYVNWIGPSGSHVSRISEICDDDESDPDDFRSIYDSLRGNVRRFGRTGAFDYCSSIFRLGLTKAPPNGVYLQGATGPLAGARLLLLQPGQSRRTQELESDLEVLESSLQVGFDALEDALCNWQKRPNEFKPFRG